MPFKINADGLKFYERKVLQLDPNEPLQKKTTKFIRFYWQTILFFIIIFFPFAWVISSQLSIEFSVDQPPGMLVKADPIQQVTQQKPWIYQGYRLLPMAEYSIRARVLGRERYTYSRGADIAPFDLGLGWGPMSDSAVLDKINISQSYRFMDYEILDETIPFVMVNNHSSNNHVIPGSEDIADQLKVLVTGQVIEIRGYLVDVEKEGSKVWTTSTKRDDKGHGACEVLWISELRVLEPKEYKPHTIQKEEETDTAE